MSLTPLNVTHQLRYPEVIRQSLASDFQFGQRTVIIEIPPIKILCTREMRFTCIGAKPSCRLDGRFRLRQARGRVVNAHEVKPVINEGELAIGIKIGWI